MLLNVINGKQLPGLNELNGYLAYRGGQSVWQFIVEVLDQDYWTNAELINGRLAMVGLVIGIFNYTVFGWVIPGFV